MYSSPRSVNCRCLRLSCSPYRSGGLQARQRRTVQHQHRLQLLTVVCWPTLALALADACLQVSAVAVAAHEQAGDVALLLQTTLGTSSGQLHEAQTVMAELEPTSSRPYQQLLQNFGDAQYVAYMTIGRQMITGIMDTGSYELVVFGADCDSCGVAAHYSAHLSKTFTPGHVVTEQTFGSGSTVSALSRERLSIGPFEVPSQAFWNAEMANMPILFNAAFEAIIGIGPPERPVLKAWNLALEAVERVQQYYSRGELAPIKMMQQVNASVHAAEEITSSLPMLATFNCTAFSVCIGARPGSDGLFIWNDPIASEQPHLFSRVPVIGRDAWTANLTNAGLGFSTGNRTPMGCLSGCSAILDTGSSVLGVPGNVIALVSMAMEGLNEDCSNLHVLPTLAFELGGLQLSLPPDAYVASVVGEMPEFLQGSAPRRGDDGGNEVQCQVMLAETSDGESGVPSWILGLPFFRKYYTTFHLGSGQAERSLFISPHCRDACTPVREVEPLGTEMLQLRRVAADRIRLSLTAQGALAGRARRG